MYELTVARAALIQTNNTIPIVTGHNKSIQLTKSGLHQNQTKKLTRARQAAVDALERIMDDKIKMVFKDTFDYIEYLTGIKTFTRTHDYDIYVITPFCARAYDND